MPKTSKDRPKRRTHNPLDEEILKERIAPPKRNRPKMRGSTVEHRNIRNMNEKSTRKVMNHLVSFDTEEKEDSIFISFDEEDFKVDMQQYSNPNEIPQVSQQVDSSIESLMGSTNSIDEQLMQTIKEKQEFSQGFTQHSIKNNLNPKVAHVYKEVGKVLRRYKSGKLPKAFKVLPSLNQWEYCLHLTNPSNWSVQAVYQATMLFRAGKKHTVERFYTLVLLPRFRDELSRKKKLNVIIFNSLRKAMYKDISFYKGILLPICEDGSITIKEANCLGSVVKKSAVRNIQAAAVLMKLVSLTYTDPIMKIIKSFLEKNIALPNQVVDSLFNFFHRFINVRYQMNLVWFEGLLGFVRSYKKEFSVNQVKILIELCKVHRHQGITPSIQLELKQRRLK